MYKEKVMLSIPALDSIGMNTSKDTIKDPPSSLQSTLSKIQTKPLYISTEDPATHF